MDLTIRENSWHTYLWQSADVQLPSCSNTDFPEWAREQFSRLYSLYVEELPENEQVPWARRLTEEALQLPEWQSLRRTVQGDVVMAAAAAKAIAEKLAHLLPKDKPPSIAKIQQIRKQIAGLRDLGIEPNELLESLHELEKMSQEYAQKIDTSLCRQEMRKACAEAQEECQMLANLSYAFGRQDGVLQYSNPERALQLWNKVRKNKRMLAIINKAGRLIRSALQKQRAKYERESQEVTEITLGRDIGRLIPVEYIAMRHPILKRHFMKSYCEESLQQYDLQAKEQRERGPIVMLIDKSSSMNGEKDIWSSAIALAMLEVAMYQRRQFAVVLFTSQVIFERYWSNHPEFEDVVEFLSQKPDGGTDFDVALKAGIKHLKRDKFEQADLIMITDGYSEVSDKTLA
ncbi:MAG: VWA domain-containing protein, partial [Candidatus Methanomethylicaceae archaeon]